jgi:hypothetical protein
MSENDSADNKNYLLEEIMKEITADTKTILDKALELKIGSELYLECSDEHERNRLYLDLKQRRSWFIEDNLTKYEQIIINKLHLNNHPNVILKKRNISSAYIRKADGKREDVTF